MHRRAIKKTRRWTTSGRLSFGRYLNTDIGLRASGSPYYYGGVSVFLVTVLSLIFFFRTEVEFWLVVFAAPMSFIPGVALFLYERYLQRLQIRIERSSGRIQAGFLLLFAFLIGYIIIFTLMFIYPMGKVIVLLADEMILDQYGHWMINLAIIASLVSWLRFQLRP